MRLLLLEDNIAAAESLSSAIDATGHHRVHHVRCLAEALKSPLQEFDVALVDLGLPDAHGTEAALALRAAAPHLPLVVLTGARSEETALQLIRLGVQDYLVKGDVTLQHVLRALRFARERKRQEGKLRREAVRDSLTGLCNRAELERELHKAISHAERQGGRAGVLLIDLDGFKGVNDLHGHATGDWVLKQVGKRLSGIVRSGDTLSRFGGDEFVIVLDGISVPEDASTVATKVIAALHKPMRFEDKALIVGASIGIAICPDHGNEAALLLQFADAAMYRAKAAGRNRHCIHDPGQPGGAAHSAAVRPSLAR